jgi:hypothetical protein
MGGEISTRMELLAVAEAILAAIDAAIQAWMQF